MHPIRLEPLDGVVNDRPVAGKESGRAEREEPREARQVGPHRAVRVDDDAASPPEHEIAREEIAAAADQVAQVVSGVTGRRERPDRESSQLQVLLIA